MPRLSTRLVIKVVAMSNVAQSVRSEDLTESVRSDVAALEARWSDGLLAAMPPHHAARIVAAALGTHASDPSVCKEWRNASRGSWLPTIDPQRALRCWAVMEIAGEVAEQFDDLDAFSTTAERDQVRRDLDAVLSEIGTILLRNARRVVNILGTPFPGRGDEVDDQIVRIAALRSYLTQAASGDQPAGGLADLMPGSRPSTSGGQSSHSR